MHLPQRLSCRAEVRADGVYLIASGELDHHTGGDLDLAMHSVLTGRPEALVLELTAVDIISAEGAAALVDAVHRAAEVCASVVILPSPAVRQRLDPLRLSQVLTLRDADPMSGHTPPAASA
jgi:anti-sigma B factor antagonist